MEKSTRTTARFPFTAPAEISRDGKVGIGARVKEISLYGCYLDFSEPYPVGTDVVLKIFSESAFFEASAKVIYANPALGMAVVFRDLKPQYMRVLQKWLLAAMQKNQSESG